MGAEHLVVQDIVKIHKNWLFQYEWGKPHNIIILLEIGLEELLAYWLVRHADYFGFV